MGGDSGGAGRGETNIVSKLCWGEVVAEGHLLARAGATAPVINRPPMMEQILYNHRGYRCFSSVGG